MPKVKLTEAREYDTIEWIVKVTKYQEFPNGINSIRLKVNTFFLGPYETFELAEEERDRFELLSAKSMAERGTYFRMKLYTIFPYMTLKTN
jgi:two-component SAPR family response regulator